MNRKHDLHRETGGEGRVLPDVTPRNIDGEDSSEKVRSKPGSEENKDDLAMPPGVAGNDSVERKEEDKNQR